MRSSCLALLLVLPFFSFSQKAEIFYDYQWHLAEPKYARFYAEIEKTDSGWRRQDFFLHDGGSLQQKGYFEDSTCKIASGAFLTLYPNKKIQSYGRYIHGKKQGLWLRFYQDGKAADSTVYDNDNPVGISMGWHHNGYSADSAMHLPDGSGAAVSWFDNGNPSSAGILSAGSRQNGRWKYYHKNGKPSSIELYDNGKFLDREYFDESGKPMSNLVTTDRPATFPGGMAAWGKYLGEHLKFPAHVALAKSDQAVVVITCTVDEDGKMENVYVSTPFYPEFETNALDVIRHSPRWIPAMNHNRKVKAVLRQPIVFNASR